MRLDAEVADVDIGDNKVLLRTGEEITGDAIIGADGTSWLNALTYLPSWIDKAYSPSQASGPWCVIKYWEGQRCRMRLGI